MADWCGHWSPTHSCLILLKVCINVTSPTNKRLVDQLEHFLPSSLVRPDLTTTFTRVGWATFTSCTAQLVCLWCCGVSTTHCPVASGACGHAAVQLMKIAVNTIDEALTTPSPIVQTAERWHSLPYRRPREASHSQCRQSIPRKT